MMKTQTIEDRRRARRLETLHRHLTAAQAAERDARTHPHPSTGRQAQRLRTLEHRCGVLRRQIAAVNAGKEA